MMNHEKKPPLTNPYEALGEAGSEKQDPTLSDRPAPTTSHRRKTRPAPEAPYNQPDEVLTLPRGARVAMRKSGGLAFNVRETIVAANGRVIQRSYGTGRPRNEQVFRLADDQMNELAVLLKQAAFPTYSGTGRYSSDTIVTELVARIGRKVKAAELGLGHVPEGLAPLLHWLERLKPSDENEQPEVGVGF